MRRRIKKVLIASSFKDIAILSSGTLIAQVIGFFLQPVATRLYTPEDFGIFNLILSLVAMFAPLITLQYDPCIVTERKDEDADKTVALCFYILLISTAIFSFGLVFYNFVSPNTFQSAGLWIYVSIPFIFSNGLVSIIGYYNNRYKQYKLISSLAVYRAVVSNIVKVILGFLKTGTIGLIISNFVTTLLGIKKQSNYLLVRKKIIFSTTFPEVIRMAKKNKEQPIFSAPGLFVVGFSYSVIPFFINSLYNNTAEVGLFALSVGVLGMPINLISFSVSKVFFRNASHEMNETGGFSKSFNSTVVLLSLLSIIPFLLLYFVAPQLFGFVFGANWIRCGVFVQNLIPLYFMNFIVKSVIPALIICKAQKLKLMLQSLFLVAAFAVFILSRSLMLPVEKFLLFYSTTYAFIYLIMLFFIYKKSKSNVNHK